MGFHSQWRFNEVTVTKLHMLPNRYSNLQLCCKHIIYISKKKGNQNNNIVFSFLLNYVEIFVSSSWPPPILARYSIWFYSSIPQVEQVARVPPPVPPTLRTTNRVLPFGSRERVGGDGGLRLERPRLLLRPPASVVHARLLPALCHSSE